MFFLTTPKDVINFSSANCWTILSGLPPNPKIPTHTGGYRNVPLSQCPGHGEALDAPGALERVASAALEPHHRPHRKIAAQPPAVARLRDRAALGGTGPRNRLHCRQEKPAGERAIAKQKQNKKRLEQTWIMKYQVKDMLKTTSESDYT